MVFGIDPHRGGTVELFRIPRGKIDELFFKDHGDERPEDDGDRKGDEYGSGETEYGIELFFHEWSILKIMKECEVIRAQ
ncbi:MAG: hypothetical protein HBSIN02_20150 [Bacteroidia bacterium]|nr:MAG: hypothetical protein HBSIN02_20150 [Bacteroidia bacterium]